MWILGVLTDLLGIGKSALSNRAKLKQLKAEQEHAIVEAQTQAAVNRITSNTSSDNQIDLQTARDKANTLKDDIVVYLFLVPVFIATFVPFIEAYKTSGWGELNDKLQQSYVTLDNLPKWYMIVLFAIIIDVLGFRSFARKIVDKYIK